MNLTEAKNYYKGNPVVKCLFTNTGKLINSRSIKIVDSEVVAKNYRNQTVSLFRMGKKAKIINLD